MPKVTIKAQGELKGGTVADMLVTGQPVWLTTPAGKVRFLIQEGAQTKLTHYATGRVLGNLGNYRLGLMASMGPGNVPTDRVIAQRMLDDVITQHGIAKVEAEFAKHPVLNP